MKQSKILVIGIIAVFLVSMMTVSASARTNAVPGTPSPGDTFIYKVTTWSVPDVFDIATDGNATSTMNLVGSEIAFKVLSADTNTYNFALYVKSGSDITITVKSSALGADAVDVLGSLLSSTGDLQLSLPANVAFPIVPQAEAYYNITQNDGPSFWVKNVNWVDVANAAASDPTLSYSETTDTATVTKSSQETDANLSIALTYSKSSSNSVFTKLELNGTVLDKNNVSHDIQVVVEYQSTNSNPLPNDFTTGQVYVYRYSKASLDISYSLNKDAEDFINTMLKASSNDIQSIQEAIDTLKAAVNTLKDNVAFQYEIGNIDGVLYQASVSQGTGLPTNVDFNGFLPVADGMLAPVVTPDWELWDGTFLLVKTAGSIYTSLLNYDTAGTTQKQNYNDMGIVSGPNVEFDATSSTSNNINYHSITLHSDAKFDSTHLNATLLNLNPTDVPPITLSSTEDLSAGVAHSSEGYLLAVGAKLQEAINFDVKVPSSVQTQTPGIPSSFTGSVNVKLEVQIKLDSTSTGVDTSVIAQASSADANVVPNLPAVQSSPGFELPIVLFS
ncbi:MAG: hypothetical protein ACFFD1_13645, partial [Candidatus Thorarchaeota archaeon]